MLLDKILLCPTAPNAVHRLLEQQKDGSLLYSRRNHSSQCEEIRLLNAASQSDKLIFINYTGLEIVNASLNPSADVIAFTTLSPSKASRDVVLPGLESVSTDNDSGDDVDSVRNHNDGDAASSERSSWHVFGTKCISDESSRVIATVEPISTIRGRFVTHLADVHPISWMKRFDISRSMYQKVIFTDYDVVKEDGKTSYKENRLLLIMNRKWVGLYSILFEPNNISIEGGVQRKWRMLSPPKSLVLARKPLWVQWNVASQRLYFVTVSKYRRTNEESTCDYSTSLSCEQLVHSDSWSRKMFSIKIDLNLKLETIRERPSTYILRDMDSTVSSFGVNMKILDLCDGGICLAWETLFYANEEENTLYKIALIDKNILVTSSSKTPDSDSLDGDTKLPCLSFSACGNNIIIKGNNKFPFLHCLAVDCINYDKSCFRYPCHYMSPKCQFVKLCEMSQLPFPMLREDYSQKKECDSIIVYDATRKTVHSLSMDPRSAKNIYFDSTVSLANRLAVTRFGRLAFTSIKDDFRDILLHFASTEMILDGERFLGTLLIHYVAEELCNEFSDIPFLGRLLPFGIPGVREDENFHMRSKCRFTEDDVASQVSQAADDRAKIASLWCDAIVVLKSCRYEPYDLASISDEFDILTSTREEEKVAKSNLRNRLEDVYEKEVSRNFENRRKSVFFAQSPEDDLLRKCIMALTYENLKEHLQRFIENDGVRKRIAVNYVITQQSAVDHYMNLFIFLIDNGKGRSLFEPISGSEWKLLQLLRKLLHTCVTINFPFPAGIQTCLACLSFRHCLAIHQTYENDDNNSEIGNINEAFVSDNTNFFKGIDISGLSFEFSQLIDIKCVQVTSEFVAKLLEDIPDHTVFGSLIQEVLSRSEFPSEKILDCMLQQWEHPYSKFCSARNTMQNLSHACSSSNNDDVARPRKGSIMPQRDPTNFEPLDIFLDDVRRNGEKFDISVTSVEAATMQCTIAQYGADSIRDIAH